MARQNKVVASGTVEVEGETFRWSVRGGRMKMIEVSGSGPGHRTTQLGGTPADVLALTLAYEIIGERKPKK